ncbi:hypothetical protein SDC9_125678 [bioreactor metagenome]|uniref:Uncharacterized protein n=1 Tax=bioreactor metagenome TaxID=1076179 RepID=A0A645CP25_9ZZZZ
MRRDVRRRSAAAQGYSGDVHDRRFPGGSRHPRGASRHRHHRAGHGRAADGKAQRDCEEAARGGDAGLRLGDLLGQNRYPDAKQNDRGGGLDPGRPAQGRADHRHPVQRQQADQGRRRQVRVRGRPHGNRHGGHCRPGGHRQE